jgi:hypothetical protein
MIRSKIFHLNRFPDPRIIDSHATEFSYALASIFYEYQNDRAC